MKYNLFLFVLASFTISNIVVSQACDCDIFPVKTECKKNCGIKLLQTGSKEQLQKTLNLEEKTAQKIASLPQRKNKTKIEDFQDDLPYNQYMDLDNKFTMWISNTGIIQTNVSGDNVAHDKIVTNITYMNGDSLGGIIEHPTTPGDFYHNARFYEISGDIKNAKENYQQYFQSDQSFIDPHIFYQELLKNSDGIDAAKITYKQFLNKHPESLMYQYLYASLLERDMRVEKCLSIYKQDSTYMPVIYQLAYDNSGYGRDTFTIKSEQNHQKFAKRFLELNKNNSYFKYYIDKREALKAIADATKTFLYIDKGEDYSNVLNVYSETGINGGYVYIRITLNEEAKKMWYKIDSMKEFVEITINSQGVTSTDNVGFYGKDLEYLLTNSKRENPLLPRIDNGNHNITIKYINMNNEEMGPYKQNIYVLSEEEENLDRFLNDWKEPSYSKDLDVRKLTDDIEFMLWFDADSSIFQTIRLLCDNPKINRLVFADGKNNSTGSDTTSDNLFDFPNPGFEINKIYTVYFIFTFFNNQVKTLKYDIKISADDDWHKYFPIEIKN
jgi:hypothetical protein